MCQGRILFRGGDDKTPKTVTLSITGELPAVIGSDGTKTYLGSDGKSVLWTEDDWVRINSQSYRVIPDPDDPTKATVENVPESSEYIAFYNGIGSGDIGQTSINARFSSFQTYRPGSFGYESGPMVAYSTTSELNFKNAGALLKVAMTGSQTMFGILFKANDAKPVSGTAEFPLEDFRTGSLKTYYPVQDESYTQDEVYMDCTSGGVQVALDPTDPTYFYFSLPAREYTDGFTLYYFDTEGNLGIQTMTLTQSLERSTILPLAPFEFTATSKPTVSVTQRTSSSLSYQISGAIPGMTLVTSVISKSFYDSLPDTYREDDLYKFAYVIEALYRGMYDADENPINISQVGSDGTASFDIPYYFAPWYNTGLVAGSEYYIVSGYM